MIATCQFCREMIVGPQVPHQPIDDEAAALIQALEYRQLSLLVAMHMSEKHPDVGREVTMAMSLAGAAVAMRYVSSADAGLDAQRVAAGDKLIAAFAPAPVEPLAALA